MPSKIITLTTDFGLKDPYVAEMKAAILSISSDAKIVDITHEIEKFSIRMGAYTLAAAFPLFSERHNSRSCYRPGCGNKT